MAGVGAMAAGGVLWAPASVAAGVRGREAVRSLRERQGELRSAAPTGAAHDAYFSRLNEMLKRGGPGRPVMLVDTQRMQHNVDALAGSVGPDKTYRVVVKSLPSVPLVERVMRCARTTR